MTRVHLINIEGLGLFPACLLEMVVVFVHLVVRVGYLDEVVAFLSKK